MTFAQIQTAVLDYCNLSSTEAQTRIGKAINRHYRRITSQIGLDASRFVARTVAMTVGVSAVTFNDIEKIDRVVDVTDADAIRPLTQVSLHSLRSTQPTTSAPTTWALQNTDADSVVILTDTVPGSAYSLRADGWTTLADLSGSDEPVFPESFHDILVWYVIAEELLKKEKDKLATRYEQKATGLLAELKFHLADSHTQTVRQGGATTTTAGSGGGGGTELPVGAVIQTVNAAYAVATDSSSSTYADTGLTATITPLYATSRILVIVHQSGVRKGTGDTWVQIKLVRGSTDIALIASQAGYTASTAESNPNGAGLTYLDSPATTSATTYKTQFASGANIAQVSVQRGSAVSSITLMEIKQ